MAEHSENVRLVPLDAWEREWIYGAIQHATKSLELVPGIDHYATATRLLDLMKKVKPVYGPALDEDGKVVPLLHH
jgi:hypothetical protein